MPIYEYQCSSCQHKFDCIQKINDEPIKTCPQCSEDTAVRLVSAAGFQLKGTGWYATDFKNKSQPDKSNPKHTDKQQTKESGSVSDGISSDTKTTESTSSSQVTAGKEE